jgi:hypothetical protein
MVTKSQTIDKPDTIIQRPAQHSTGLLTHRNEKNLTIIEKRQHERLKQKQLGPNTKPRKTTKPAQNRRHPTTNLASHAIPRQRRVQLKPKINHSPTKLNRSVSQENARLHNKHRRPRDEQSLSLTHVQQKAVALGPSSNTRQISVNLTSKLISGTGGTGMIKLEIISIHVEPTKPKNTMDIVDEQREQNRPQNRPLWDTRTNRHQAGTLVTHTDHLSPVAKVGPKKTGRRSTKAKLTLKFTTETIMTETIEGLGKIKQNQRGHISTVQLSTQIIDNLKNSRRCAMPRPIP